MLTTFIGKLIAIIPTVSLAPDEIMGEQSMMYSGYLKGFDDTFVYLSQELELDPVVAIRKGAILHIELESKSIDDMDELTGYEIESDKLN